MDLKELTTPTTRSTSTMNKEPDSDLSTLGSRVKQLLDWHGGGSVCHPKKIADLTINIGGIPYKYALSKDRKGLIRFVRREDGTETLYYIHSDEMLDWEKRMYEDFLIPVKEDHLAKGERTKKQNNQKESKMGLKAKLLAELTTEFIEVKKDIARLACTLDDVKASTTPSVITQVLANRVGTIEKDILDTTIALANHLEKANGQVPVGNVDDEITMERTDLLSITSMIENMFDGMRIEMVNRARRTERAITFVQWQEQCIAAIKGPRQSGHTTAALKFVHERRSSTDLYYYVGCICTATDTHPRIGCIEDTEFIDEMIARFEEQPVEEKVSFYVVIDDYSTAVRRGQQHVLTRLYRRLFDKFGCKVLVLQLN